jgi:hypothetical protein
MLPDSSVNSPSHLSHDPSRLRLHAIIERSPSRALTAEGIRVVVFYAQLHILSFGPLLDTDQPPTLIEITMSQAPIENVFGDCLLQQRPTGNRCLMRVTSPETGY